MMSISVSGTPSVLSASHRASHNTEQWQKIWVGQEGAASPPLQIAMNIHSIKLFNNVIKNTLLAPMFCSLVKS